jgi:putative nucleotidyltransferase with HDIG domain
MFQRRDLLVWLWPLVAAATITLVAAIEWAYFPTTPTDKGTRAAYTLRVPRDIALSLQDLRREEIREALERYLPIYDQDAELLERRRVAIVAEIGNLPATSWKWADGDEPLEGPQNDIEREARRARDQARVLEVTQLAGALFPLLEPNYRDGVIADDQFPAREREIRVYAEGRYRRVPVGELHRFSELRPLLREAGQRFFFKTEERVREQVIAWVLDRLPPNLRYAKENAKHIADISQVTGVKVELLRRGDVLARRGQVVDGRVHYALRAASEVHGPRSGNRALAAFGLALAACALLTLAGRELQHPPLDHRAIGLVLGFAVVTILLDRVLLLLTPLAEAAVPLAAVPIATGIILGRGVAIATSVTVVGLAAAGGALDATTVLVLLGSALAGSFVTRPRRRGSALVAGAVAGIAAVAAYAACVALGARPRTLGSIWTATQALGGAFGAGLVALLWLPAAERLVGRTSLGRLRALCDYERPLLRELRRRAPVTFAHSVALANIAEAVADAVGAEPLLCRAGALYHDVGKIEHPERYSESGRVPVGPDTHVAAGLRLCERYRVPDDVKALVRQHQGARTVGGEAPGSLEAVIILVAEATLDEPRRPGEPVSEHVARVVNDAFAAGRLFESGATQAELWRIREACVEALREERREEAEPLQEEFVAVEQPEGDAAKVNDSAVPEEMPGPMSDASGAGADPHPGTAPRKAS